MQTYLPIYIHCLICDVSLQFSPTMICPVFVAVVSFFSGICVGVFLHMNTHMYMKYCTLHYYIE